MPTITVQKIVNDAKTILQETTGVRWSDMELMGWVSAAQREVVMLVPSAFTTVFAQTLAPNTTRQGIPADGYAFIDIIGSSAGQAVTPIEKTVMDRLRRGWRYEAASDKPLHYVFDPRQPREYHIYPRPATGVSVELVYSVCPPELTSLSQTIAIDDIYTSPLTDYTLYRAYSKDLETVGNAERAAGHYTAFSTTLGLKAQAVASNQPVPAVR